MIKNAITILDPKSSFNSGKISGYVKFYQKSLKSKTIVDINLSGFKPNTYHGIHVHTYGDLSKGCSSACDHFNPKNKKHGSNVLYGKSRHIGDLCNNVYADSNGNVNFLYMDNLVKLNGINSIIGRSIVIHENEDDLGLYRDEDSERGKLSRTTGNAGGRIACSIIGISKS